MYSNIDKVKSMGPNNGAAILLVDMTSVTSKRKFHLKLLKQEILLII